MDGRRKITSIRFNQSFDCFSCCLDGAGIQVYNVEPLALMTDLPFERTGNASFCEMLRRTSLLTFVGKDKFSKFSHDQVVIWFEETKRMPYAINMKTKVLSVCVREDMIVVATLKQITIFSVTYTPYITLKKVAALNTPDNIYGLCEITPQLNSATNLIFYPDHKPGSLRWESLTSLTSSSPKSSSTMLNSKQAHESAISCIAVNFSGTMVATSSIKGTVFRVFDTIKREVIIEFRRGVDQANIFSLVFHPASNFLAVTSNKKTVHIFSLAKKDASGVLPNYDFAKFTVTSDFLSVCGFSGNSVYAIDANANFYKYLLTKDGCILKSFTDFTENMEQDLF